MINHSNAHKRKMRATARFVRAFEDSRYADAPGPPSGRRAPVDRRAGSLV